MYICFDSESCIFCSKAPFSPLTLIFFFFLKKYCYRIFFWSKGGQSNPVGQRNFGHPPPIWNFAKSGFWRQFVQTFWKKQFLSVSSAEIRKKLKNEVK